MSNVWYAAVIGLLLVVLVVSYTTELVIAPAPATSIESKVVAPVEESATTTLALPGTLVIPRLELTASFTAPLGLQPSGEVAVPDSFTEVGWYQHSPLPGALGPSVVLGHVDSYRGPAVFWRLRELVPGDLVMITRVDGSVATFTVDRLETYAQDSFPTMEVYGNIDYRGLRLITCSGVYDRGTLRYSHNTVVYARLQEEIAP